MRHPEVMKDVVAELDDLYADGSEVSFQALRSIPRLEAALKETLRLHPPLIILLRVVQEEIELAGHTDPARAPMVAATPAGLEPDRRGLPRAGAASTRAATSTRARRTCRTAGPGSRSAPASTAASATRSR